MLKGVERLTKNCHLGIEIWSLQNMSSRPTVKRCSFSTVCERGIIFYGSYMKRLPFLSKMVYKRVRVWTSGSSLFIPFLIFFYSVWES